LAQPNGAKDGRPIRAFSLAAGGFLFALPGERRRPSAVAAFDFSLDDVLLIDRRCAYRDRNRPSISS